MMEKRAIALISGGLDSVLAAKIVLDQGVEVIGLHILHPFLALRPGSFPARKVCAEIGIPFRVVYRGRELLRIVERPVYGYGANLNPCIDCRIFDLREAKRLMEEERASFVISGEVVGQRPMSQRREAIRRIERECGLEGYILRPLSARVLSPTVPEQEGIVDREKLGAIAGRGRKEQLRLAREYGIREYSAPAGGCLLTDPGYCRRLRDLLTPPRPLDLGEVKLLRRGRHFRLGPDTKVVVGRDHRENVILRAYCLGKKPYYLTDGFPGPEAGVSGPTSPEVRDLVGGLLCRYGKPPSYPAEIREILPGGRETVFRVARAVPEEEIRRLRID